ncbi:sensor histidine kinase [Winogradskya humida]|nr:histidine kinase [Actinoplanes humidus]
MNRWTTWVLPVLLCAGQLALWPGDDFPSVTAVAGGAVILLIGAALGLRTSRPVEVTVAVVAGISLGTWVAPAGQLVAFPGDALLVISFADQVALFSVAALRSYRATVLTLVGLVLWQVPLTVARDGVTGDLLPDLIFAAVLYVVVAAFGRRRAHWRADRSEAARRLAEATRAERDAADAERRRLARELHDVTAHHLTSIVVNASAAQMLAAKRPELHEEALDYATRTGRETLAALRELVAIMPWDAEPSPETVPALGDLADDFRQLGQVITVTAPAGPLPPALAAAVHGIAREALTNTLRYAPGAKVDILLRHTGDHTELVIDDAGSVAAPAAAGLGGGRGTDGMRDRAVALGGTLVSGPRDNGGGWRVQATFPHLDAASPQFAAAFPLGGAARGRPFGVRVRGIVGAALRRVRSDTLIDGALMAGALILPVLSLILGVEEDGITPAAATLILLALLSHALPLFWRRGHPWWALAAVALTAWTAPLLLATGGAPAVSASIFLVTIGADLVAVYSVAARGARPGLTWLAPIAATASWSLSLAVMVLTTPQDPPREALPTGAVLTTASIAVVAVLAAVALTLPMTASWLTGWAIRRRRTRRLDHEHHGVATALAQATARTHEERTRVATGLRDAVLHHAAEVPAAAEAGDLPRVLTAARQALTAMRALLDGLGRTPPPTAPTPDPHRSQPG